MENVGQTHKKGIKLKNYLAIDIGASSGRHIVGHYENGELITEEVYRFPNGAVDTEQGKVWDINALTKGVISGIKSAFDKFGEIYSISIDTWGVDYVLMRGDEPLMPCYAYRDGRTKASIPLVHAIVSEQELYARTGIQFQPFNTVYQLYADKMAGRLDGVTDFLLIPEYLSYVLTGVKKHEFTNATTGALVKANTTDYDLELMEKLGLPTEIFGKLSLPGEVVGDLTEEIQKTVGGNARVVLCASHDTASAVEAIDMDGDELYLSSGTWSLLGAKAKTAVTSEESRLNGFTNEGGVGYYRYLKNITGMWLVQSLKSELCPDLDFGSIVDLARASKITSTVNVNADDFYAPKSMAKAIENYLKERGQTVPSEVGDYFKVAYDSIALGYKTAVDGIEKSLGKKFSKLYIVGGGAKNGYLNALTQEKTGKTVVALPIEATAIGNIKIQAGENRNE
ncbi:MAG: rhamnulokinase [Clostridia bacterium]|nr:rhamnulokinase [Clostridia bacterium]